MSHPLTAKSELSQLVIVDMQTRLATAMPQAAMQAATKNASVLAQAAALLAIPTLLTEQYPKGLGNTIAELSAVLTNIKPVEKLTFSCLAEAKFSRQLTADRPQLVLAGMEAHICVLQTALDLLSVGKQVFVVEDAVISRDVANKANAVARLRDAGCIITNTESVVFEWLGIASGDHFKTISQLIR